MSAVTCLRARDRQESGYNGPALAMQLLLYPETALPFTTRAGSENCTGYYLETSGVLLFAWNMLPQGQVCTVHVVHAPVFHWGCIPCFCLVAAVSLQLLPSYFVLCALLS